MHRVVSAFFVAMACSWPRCAASIGLGISDETATPTTRAPSVIVITLLLAVSVRAEPEQEQRFADPPELAVGIDRIVAPYVAARDFMGVVAVQRSGEDSLILPYGLASAELGVPHDASSVFMIGSITKQFTAAAILLLEQEDRLRTRDLVSKHLADFKPGDAITIEQLLTHTSGVADVYSLRRFGETAGRSGSFAEVIADIAEMPLTHAPGSAYAYSNGAYSVLAAIIERASGMSYADYLATRIFEPLGMTVTSNDENGPVITKRVAGYDPWGSRDLTATVPPAEAYMRGSGSLWSSARDLLIWTRALHGGQLLSEASYAKLTQDYGNAYGYGLSVFRRFGRRVFGHDGRLTGYASDAAHYPDERTTIVVLSNVQSAARDEIRRQVAAIVFDEALMASAPNVFAERPMASRGDLAGSYAFGPAFTVSIREADGRLLARANEGAESELLELADGNWFSRVLYATVRFRRNEDAQVDALIWGEGEQAPVGPRVE